MRRGGAVGLGPFLFSILLYLFIYLIIVLLLSFLVTAQADCLLVVFGDL